MVLLEDGALSLIEIKSSQTFTLSLTKAFKKLENTKYIKGKNAISSTSNKISILSDGTYIIPFSAI